MVKSFRRDKKEYLWQLFHSDEMTIENKIVRNRRGLIHTKTNENGRACYCKIWKKYKNNRDILD
jgi:hypothetical protein